MYVNSLRNKFVAVDELIKNKIDVCLTSETKVGKTFPNQQFKINGYKMLRKDRDRFGGGLMFYVNEQIPSKVLSLESIPMDTELILLEFPVKIKGGCALVYIDHHLKTKSILLTIYQKH